jgi:hypothetical protein
MIHNLWNIVSTTYAGAAGMSLQIYTYKQFYFDELLEVHVFTPFPPSLLTTEYDLPAYFL